MKHITKLFMAIALLMSCIYTKAQNNDTLDLHRSEKGIVRFARFQSSPSSNRKMNNDTLFLKSILRAKSVDGFRKTKEFTDELGIMHKRFQQYYKGIKVENAEYLIHGKNGNIEAINGDFQDISISSTKPSINEQQALAKALVFVGAKKYKWEDAGMEKFAKQNTNDPNATYFPKGELVISKDYLKGSNTHKLSWKFTISSMEPNNEQLIYVDASNGDIINNVSLIYDTNIPCTAQTLYSGTQTITGDTSNNEIKLQENRNGVNVYTLNLGNTYDYAHAGDFTNTTTSYTRGSWPIFNRDQCALDAHWGAEKVLDYWRASPRNRNSIDGNGLRVINYVHAGISWPNAKWVGGPNNNFMLYGDGDGTIRPLTSLDVSAHEFGHGITQFTANLAQGAVESAALNEGFSDIWGACVEYWAAPNKQTWRMGEELFPSTSTFNCIRDLQNPKSTATLEGPHPDTYKGTYWYYGSDADIFSHTNSTVLSHWFYLLSQGGSGTNDLGNSYRVHGIGIDVAQKIAYMAESVYVFSSADYNAVKDASLIVAMNQYCVNSLEYMQVINAWYAVGLCSAQTQISITGNTLVCSSSANQYTVNNVPPGCTISWSVSSGWLQLVSSSGNTAYFQGLSNGCGPGLIQATITSPEGTVSVITYAVWVGVPVVSNVSGPSYNQVGAYAGYSATVSDIKANATSFNWTLNPGIFNNYFNPGYNCYITWNRAGQYVLQVNTQNSCPGVSSTYYYPITVAGSRYLSISPNPANDNIQVSIIKAQNTSLTSDVSSTTSQLVSTDIDVAITYTVKIYNSFGTLFYSAKKLGDTFTVPINNLKDGTYIIEANDGKQSYKQQLIIKH